MELDFYELEKRAAEIAEETADADKEQLETLNAELDAIEERKKDLAVEVEKKKKDAADVANGAGSEIETRKGKDMAEDRIYSDLCLHRHLMQQGVDG